MNSTLKSTLDILRAIARVADVKVSRGFADFLSDRIMQATTQPTLLAMVERISKLLNAEIEHIDRAVFAIFLKQINNPDAADVLSWLRSYHNVAVMIITQKSDLLYDACINDIAITGSTQEKGTALPSAENDIKITAKCLSPLAHGADTKAGNASLFRRMHVLSTTGQTLLLPFYAGNAVRGRMRDLLADHFLASLGLTPRKDNPPCNLWFFHALYAGGALEENSEQAKAFGKKIGSGGAARAEGIHEFRNMIPPLSVLGTALGNRIISGRVNICDFRPVCKEWGNGEISEGNLFEWTYLTRREDHENHAEGENASMIVNTECLKAGVSLVGGIDVSYHVTEIERSCLGAGLKLLQNSGYLGAENRRGLGQVKIEIEDVSDENLYEAYLLEKKTDILNYLISIGGINASSIPNRISN